MGVRRRLSGDVLVVLAGIVGGKFVFAGGGPALWVEGVG
jgi:hypothetical protein